MDDPEASVVYQQVVDLSKQLFDDDEKRLFFPVQLPGSDQLLNMLLRGAKIALQLSHFEGYEVKVTEALLKGVPVIAYKAGCIPAQIRDGVSGFLCNVGDVDSVAHHIHRLLSDNSMYRKVSEAASTKL